MCIRLFQVFVQLQILGKKLLCTCLLSGDKIQVHSFHNLIQDQS